MPDSTLAVSEQLVADLRRQLAESRAERDVALQQQTATAEVLQVINSSPGDLAPIFDAMLEKATRLAEASFGILMTYDGENFHTVALHGVPHAYGEYLQAPIRPSPLNGLGRLLSGERLIHIADITADKAYAAGDLLRKATAELGGSRTHLLVPLLKDTSLLGTFVIYRQEVRPFSDKQIALLQNFAAQAVIAMENARLLGELQARTGDLEESLEYQTATSDVLNVISRSTADVQPVLDTVAETAVRLCSADSGTIHLREGEVYRVASSSFSAPEPELWATLRQRTFVPGRDSVTGRVALDGRVVHIEDIRAIPDYATPETVASGRRTALGVPLLREGAVIGTINVSRKRVEPFTDRQIELVRTFADQAVIAIENARLFAELQARTRDLEESLEYQTATGDVLNVISRSTADVQPVLDTVTETAARLCGADSGTIWIREGEAYRPVASSFSAAEPEWWAGGARRQGRACRGHPRYPGLRGARGCEGRGPYCARSAAAARGGGARHDWSRAETSAAIHRAADRTGAHLCRPGGDRDGECAVAR